MAQSLPMICMPSLWLGMLARNSCLATDYGCQCSSHPFHSDDKKHQDHYIQNMVVPY